MAEEATTRSLMRRMMRAVQVFRTLDPTLPVQVVHIFLLIASDAKQDVPTRDIPEKIGLAQSSVNRALTYLADHHWKDKSKAGLGLIEHRVDTMDRRQRLVRLTPKGRTVLRQIEEIIAHE